MPKVIIAMPAYHAASTLEQTLDDIPVGVADEVILVDDASDDGTVDLARRLGIPVYAHPRNRGYGGNQKTCYVQALERGADIVVLLHPDYQYDPRAVPLLVAPILTGQADMTFGSRFAGLADPRGGGMPIYRYIGNRVTTVAENLMLGSRFTELHSGLRAYTRDCLLRLPFLRYTDDFGFDSQLLVDAVTSGQRVVEVPIMTRYTRESSSISVLRSLRYVSTSLAYCGRTVVARGRRGRRWPVTFTGSRRSGARGGESPVAGECVLCGAPELRLLYPANTEDKASVSEFSCTSSELAKHDDIVRCAACGMVSARPAMAVDEIAAAYADLVDEDYLSEESARRRLFEWVLGRVSGYALSGNRLLEVGANVGVLLDIARERGWDARGIEPSRWAVELGRSRFAVHLEQGTVETLAAEPASADAVVMLDVLEHVVDPVAALRRLRIVVQDEGVLALSTVNVVSIHARLRRHAWPWFIRPHLHYFTPETLDATLAAAGFDLVDWSVMPRPLHLSYVARRARSTSRALAALADHLPSAIDATLPFGRLGDVVFVIARPRRPMASTDQGGPGETVELTQRSE
jgi:2-polyprenyl-3-methyl-5-hydroxy-6-metoxy-1,4-benzoquinol methylase